MDDYLSLTLLSHPGEAEAAFKARLAAFWSKLLREKPDEFERVYAEQVASDRHGDRVGRKYLIVAGVEAVLVPELAAAGLDHQPVDPDDVYSKYEAAPPDWFWIEH